MNFTAIDFETANSDRGSVCSVGLARVENGEVVGGLHQLIRPEPLVFDPMNVAIHGISARDVADAPTFAEFWPTLWRAVSGPLVAHNAAFDMSVLRYSLDRAGLAYPETDYFCTLVISRLIWPHRSTHALNHIASDMGLSFQHHDAAEDARVCALVALAACRQLEAPTLYRLPERCTLRMGRLYAGGYCPCGALKARHRASPPRPPPPVKRSAP